MTGSSRSNVLGKALSDSSLRGARFEIAGHTDAVGSVEYNQRLSEARAGTVRDYLLAHAGLDPQKLVAIGFGKLKLYDTANPTAGINRRVQITRLSSK